jgi:hypothetical protein|nr:MAG TPA: hypothetical protein [Caudoviricetes sp.]
MTDLQKEVLAVLAEVLPIMPKEAQNYLLGYGEGLIMAYKGKKEEPEEKAS